MTIKELIKQLQEVENEDMVVMCHDEVSLAEVCDVEIHDMIARKKVREFVVIS